MVAGTVAVAATVAAVAVARSSGGDPQQPRSTAFSYSAGLHGALYLPSPAPKQAPLVVLVPGGGWTSADPAGLRPLAGRFAAAGIAAATTTYRVGTAARFPVPVSDVLCAVAAAAAIARTAGVVPRPIVVLGHSAGAQLGAVAALAADRFRGACDRPAVRIDAFVGLAGPYDIARFASVAEPLLGTPPASDPQAWRAANPLTWVAQRPELPAFLAAGTADDLVPPSFTIEFATALRQARHPVRVLTVDGATHASIYRAHVIAGPVIEWARGLRT